MRNAGFTIVELLVAMLLVAIVMVFTMQVFTENNRTYTQIDSVVDTQQSIRAVGSMLERDLRHAGMMVPESTGICGLDDTDEPDLLYISDHTAIDPEDAIGFFDGARIQGAATAIPTGTTTITLDTLIMEPDVPDPSYDTNGDGTNDSDFVVNGGVIIADLMDPDRGNVCGIVTNVDLVTPAITVDIKTANMTPSGGGTVSLVAVPALEYRVDAATDRLYRNNLQLADGVEDLQVAYFLDANGNGAVDAGEFKGDSAGNGYLAGAADVSELRAVRFNIVARARLEDDRFTQGFFQSRENRDPGVAADGFRRRVHTAVVRMRNIGDRVEGL